MARQLPKTGRTITEKEAARAKEMFSLFDLDRDGAIFTRDIIAVVRSLGWNPTEQEIKDLIEEFDSEGEGTIEFDPFLILLGKLKHEGDSLADIEQAFRVFDQDGSGYISASELRNVMTNLGEKLTDEEVAELIDCAGPGDTGQIRYPDFIKELFSETPL